MANELDYTFEFNDGSVIAFNDQTPIGIGQVESATNELNLLQVILLRLKNALPKTWFVDSTIMIDAIMTGFAWCCLLIHDNIQEVIKQLRIKTMTGAFLDLTSYDFFGVSFPRRVLESDTIFATRIINNIFAEKVTFASLYNVVDSLMSLIGATTSVYEHGASVSTSVAKEDGSGDVLTEDGINVINTEDATITIPTNSYPIGLNSSDAAARYNTQLQLFEALVIIKGTLSGGIVLEDGATDLELENGNTVNTELLLLSDYQYLFDAIMKVKPIGTVVWVSLQ